MKSFFIRLSFFLVYFFSLHTFAKTDASPLFIHLSDAMGEAKKGNEAKILDNLTALSSDFQSLESHSSTMGKQVTLSLKTAIADPNLANLETLSKSLYAFEKEQNPIDYTAKRQQFTKRVLPIYQQLNQAIKANDLEGILNAYKRFNTTWTLNEMVVRDTSLGHYGQIETEMALFRVAMLAEPADFNEMQHQADLLGATLNDFKSGNVIQPQSNNDAPQNLASGIQLLEKSYNEFEQNNLDQGKADITLFIQQWAIFEGEVSTRDGQLYTMVESELPLILARGNESANMQKFKSLIDDLNNLDIAKNYSAFDAMVILLREGVEALLIIMALVTALNAANQYKAKKWVYTGAGLGVFASILCAIALQQFFPTVSAGANREILEGLIGVIAVLMMLVVGAWLHSKSSLSGWKKFVDKQISQALATGSLISMLSLSFLSVFREGAETILFYVGMLPLIELKDLLLGIGFALVLLVTIAFVMSKSTTRLPIHHLFKLMTFLIYVLAFKILGVSIHALQLTNMLSTHLIEHLPNISWLGFYTSWEGVIAQLIYLMLIPIVAKIFNK